MMFYQKTYNALYPIPTLKDPICGDRNATSIHTYVHIHLSHTHT